jgi:hypothetical protein
MRTVSLGRMRIGKGVTSQYLIRFKDKLMKELDEMRYEE